MLPIWRPLLTTIAILTAAPPLLAQQSRPAASAATQRYPVESATGLRLHHTVATSVMYEGKRGVRLALSDDAKREMQGLPAAALSSFETLAIIEGSAFTNGIIEAEIAGIPAPDAAAGARGFVGIAFRVQPDLATYDAFYLRPTNGRANDQERRNHSAQYIAHPNWTWDRLRRETPGRYESYVDLVAGAWTKVRIEVHGDSARLFVHGQSQPTLVVHDVKSGASARGSVALWIDSGTVAHFRDVRVTPTAR